MPDDASVAGDHETKTVPSDSSFIAADKGAEANNHANSEERADPPIACDCMMKMHEDASG